MANSETSGLVTPTMRGGVNQAPELIDWQTIPDVSHYVAETIDINLMGYFHDPAASTGDATPIPTNTLSDELRLVNSRIIGQIGEAGEHEITVYAGDGGARSEPVT